MARISFEPGRQREFFEKVRFRSGLSFSALAKKYSIGERSFRDWRREKFSADYEKVLMLSTDFHISIRKAKKVDDYWYTEKGSSIGGKAHYKLYGAPGTLEDRRKGGRVSQERRRKDPEKYRELGCNVKKVFAMPPYSERLAELVGILMGDGSMSDYQVRVTLSRKVDRAYAVFVRSLMEDLIGEKPTWIERAEYNTIDLILSGAGLVEVFEYLGLERGDKIAHQISIPEWIQEKQNYQIACVRGLFDTDGGFYFHQKARRKYLGWSFSSSSRPLLQGVMDILLELGFNIRKGGVNKLYMYHLEHMSRYMRVIGSNNPKNTVKLEQRMGYVRKGA
ncbi:hypothetical protein A2780_00130 [Candidatus Daviesbacteria bacterium RIFCSPHIGHO2_01_FULL_41_45]|nr:MAG: hypothetical protein A2780_00130 [Candidatus Daviesbacteria bacterium RIFCSPHIGHO2_01_FULL_41_45]